VGNPETFEIRIPDILKGHNFFYKPLIEMKFKEKL
jgi:hypothetical protein